MTRTIADPLPLSLPLPLEKSGENWWSAQSESRITWDTKTPVGVFQPKNMLLQTKLGLPAVAGKVCCCKYAVATKVKMMLKNNIDSWWSWIRRISEIRREQDVSQLSDDLLSLCNLRFLGCDAARSLSWTKLGCVQWRLAAYWDMEWSGVYLIRFLTNWIVPWATRMVDEFLPRVQSSQGTRITTRRHIFCASCVVLYCFGIEAPSNSSESDIRLTSLSDCEKSLDIPQHLGFLSSCVAGPQVFLESFQLLSFPTSGTAPVERL